ncbi:phosphonatase-like hydrolase [Flagellimonas nanhaiensis]|uniref:Phosphonatase-like hydrolase n=1 Tax=Flagellimonas nanhaiensis TaxID=2292706 RepID=A0A371JRB3_9FLAO|nr:phosphonatase-like hydrolase [Allomuricauda nanhaiensis]RDY60058.1 phosphonatase-like hydrolase [Allomuricauda nanhaiensis]
MKDIKLAVFDMAGTTVNEDNVVYKTVQRALEIGGFKVPLEKVLELGAGKEKYKAIEDILNEEMNGAVSKEKMEEIYLSFKRLLGEAYDQLEVAPYKGVEELFGILRSNQVKVVLNTGYDYRTAKTLVDKLGWEIGKEVDALITADDVEIGRPSSEMIDRAMEQFGIESAEQVLKAGDSVIDIEEGKNANCGMTVGVLTGAHTREQLVKANPTLILENLEELGKVLFPK